MLRYVERTEDFYEARAEALPTRSVERVKAEALARSVVNEFEGYVKLNKKMSPEVIGAVQQIDDYAKLADTVASHLAVKIPDKQAVLEIPTITKRLEKVPGAHGKRDLGPAGGKAHPHAGSSARWRRPSANTI